MIKSHDYVGNSVQKRMSTHVGSIRMAIIYPPYKLVQERGDACISACNY